VRPLGGNNFREKVLRPDVRVVRYPDEMVALTDAKTQTIAKVWTNDRNQALPVLAQAFDRDRGIGQHEETLGFQFFAYPVGKWHEPLANAPKPRDAYLYLEKLVADHGIHAEITALRDCRMGHEPKLPL
jgi:hypothetical protein